MKCPFQAWSLLRDPLLASLLLVVLAAGCVTEVVREKPLEETTLIVSQSGTTATLQWESSPDALYTVLFSETRKASAEWKPLPGYVKVRGSGGTITVTDSVPRGEMRQYRIYTEPLKIDRH
jgi:hypothetical protein